MKDEMGRTYGTDGGKQKFILLRKSGVRGNTWRVWFVWEVNTEVNVGAVQRKGHGLDWTGLIWLRIRSNGGLL
jgi:hypothetical protein